MKKLLLSFLLAPLALVSGEVGFAWQPSPTPGVTNYALTVMRGTNSQTVNVGTNLTATLEFTAGSYTATVRAQKDGLLSDPSNAVSFELPESPTNARLVIVERIVSTTNAVELFRLKIP